MSANKGIWGAIASILLILFDQWTKHLAVVNLKGQDAFVIWDKVFELRYLENRGASFGIFQNQRWPLIIFTIVVLIGLVYIFFRRLPNERHYFPLHLIAVLFFAGAIGNFIDRLRFGYVVDFFYFCLIDFPIFNVADIYVVIAACLLIVLGLFYYKDEDWERILKR